MSGPELEKLQNRLYEGVQKFDYFLTGVSAAALAYSVQSYAPVPGEVARWLVATGWVLLGFSFYSGLLHQKKLLQLMAVVFEVHQRHENFDELMSARHKHAMNAASSGGAQSEEALATERNFQENENALSVLYKQQESLPRAMTRWDSSRGICFLVGIGALGLWKLINFWVA